jgi:hypothetical protein
MSIIEEDDENSKVHDNLEAKIKAICHILGIYINIREEKILQNGFKNQKVYIHQILLYIKSNKIFSS